MPNNWCLQTVVLKKTPVSPLDSEGIKLVNLKEINPEYSLEGLRLKLKLQILWPCDAKSQFVGKDPDSGKDRGQEEKRVTEKEMVGWHH